MRTIAESVRQAATQLSSIGVTHAAREAELLLAAVLDKDRVYLRAFDSQVLTAQQTDRFQSYLERRVLHEPVSRILGRREFWSLEFDVTPATLDPRPDTETLVEAALTLFPDGVDTFVDVGTGTGCIAIALLTEWPTARAIVTDISEEALVVAQRNATRLGVADRFDARQGSWLDPVAEQVALIVSNPPYIDRSEALAPEVKDFDPHTALYADHDGLAAYEALWSQAVTRLKPAGWAVMEIGWQQKHAVEGLATQAGFQHIETRQDLAGRDRVVLGTHISGETTV